MNQCKIIQANEKSMKETQSYAGGGGGHIKYKGEKKLSADGYELNILITYAMAKAIKQKKKSKGNPNNYPKSKFESNNFNFENIDLNKEYNFY